MSGPPDGDPISLLMVEDHLALRSALELLLGRQGCVVVGSAERASDAWNVIRTRRPDVSIIDVHLPDESGVALTKRLLAEDPNLGVLLYTGAADGKTLSAALDSGARGVALKAAPPRELIDAVRTIARGEAYVDPRLSSVLSARSTPGTQNVLSPREREVFQLLAKGLTGEDAAVQLHVSPETIRTHVRNAMRKLGARTRTHAVVLALQRGELER
jgi:DNA-binding NarL/FixJ family response regulator